MADVSYILHPKDTPLELLVTGSGCPECGSEEVLTIASLSKPGASMCAGCHCWYKRHATGVTVWPSHR